MSKMWILFLVFWISISVNVSAQDTIINSSAREVQIVDTINKYRIIYHYKKDITIKDGEYRLLSERNDLKFTYICNYRNNLKSGKAKAYHNEKLTSIYTFKADKLQGKTIEYLNGKKLHQGKYKSDKKTGKWKYFDNEGNLIAKGGYSGTFFDVNIDTNSIMTLLYSNGKIEKFHYNDTVSRYEIYRKYDLPLYKRNYLREGVWKYFEQGKVIQIMRYDETCELIFKRILKENDYRYLIMW